MRLIICLLLFLILPVKALAAPAISSIPASYDDGETVTINGTGFGTNALTYSFLGGRDGYIAQGVWDTWPSGWSRSNTSQPDPFFTTEQTRARGRTIAQHRLESQTYPEHINYYFNGATEVYVSFWMYCDTNSNPKGDSQLKILRFGPDSDTNENGTDWGFYTKYFNGFFAEPLFSTTALRIDSYPGDDYGLRYMLNRNIPGSLYQQFHRLEYEFVLNSSVGAEDGEMTIRRQAGVSNPVQSTSNTTWELRPNGIDNTLINYFILQAYWGNGIFSDSPSTAWGTFFSDDHFAQKGTAARVELCAGSTWSARGRCEIQPPTSWSDTAIAITANSIMFEEGSKAYVYVVHDDKTNNANGFEVTIGDSTPIEYAVCYRDGDLDLYGDLTSGPIVSPLCPTDYYLSTHFASGNLQNDCDDSSAAINPGATETADDGIDQDCDGFDLISGAVCDASHLNLCLTTETCTGAGGNYCPPCQATACPESNIIKPKGVRLLINAP